MCQKIDTFGYEKLTFKAVSTISFEFFLNTVSQTIDWVLYWLINLSLRQWGISLSIES